MEKCVSEKIDIKYIVLMLAFILTCSNALFTQVCLPKIYAFLGLLSVSLFAFFLNHKPIIKRDSFYYVFALIACITFSNILNLDLANINGSILVVIRILTALLISQTFDRVIFWKYYKYAILVICVFSLMFNYVYPLFFSYSIFPTLVNSSDIVFYNAILTVKISSYGYFDIRNYGVFSEPAVFCFFIFCAIIVEFYDDKITVYKTIRVIIFAVSLISTFSPMGMVISLGFTFLYFVKLARSGKHTIEIFIFVVLIGISMYILTNNQSLNDGLDNMMSKMSLNEGNGKGRLDAILMNLECWFDKPLFGNSLEAIVSLTQDLGFNTSTTGTMLACYGIFFTSLTVYLQYRSLCLFIPKSNLIEKAVVITLFFLAVNNHGFLQSDFFWVFSLFSLGEDGIIFRVNKKRKLNEKNLTFNNDP